MGGSHKVTSDDEGEGGGVTIPPKNDDVIYEQPLTTCDSVATTNTEALEDEKKPAWVT